MANVKFRVGTQAQYDALATKDSNALYWLTDTQNFAKGDKLFGTGSAASETKAGLMSATDKTVLNELAENQFTVSAKDASIVITGDDEKQIGVSLSEASGNLISLKTDGLYVGATEGAEFAIEKMASPTSGYAASYKLKKTVGEESSYVGDTIDIPKDMVVESGSLKTVTVEDEPYAGAKVGDPYIDLVLANASSDHIYIPVKGLVDVYTAGNGISIDNNKISVKLNSTAANGLTATESGLALTLASSTGSGAMSATDKAYLGTVPTLLSGKTDKSISGTNGTAFIFNESDGGGAKFEHKDGSEVFVGVNDGGKSGLMAQIYADELVEGRWVGSRINVYHDGIFYTSLAEVADGVAKNDAMHEIAVRKDISDAIDEALTWGNI